MKRYDIEAEVSANVYAWTVEKENISGDWCKWEDVEKLIRDYEEEIETLQSRIGF